MRLYHFKCLKYGMDSIRNSRLKISQLDDLNDPYELLGADLSNEELRAGYVAMRDKISATQGIICFSKEFSMPIMWGHYADKHKGMAIGFDVSDDVIMEVIYSSNRQSFVLDMLHRHDAEKHMHRFLATKHDAWSYERECRIFAELSESEDGIYFEKFDSNLQIAEVLLGVRCDPDCLQQYTEIIKSQNEKVRVFSTELSQSKFEIRRGQEIF